MTENEEILALFEEMRNEHIRDGWTPIFLEEHEEVIS